MEKSDIKIQEFIKFLGTAGARFVMIKQLRASGGVWISSKGKNILLDPGPGSIVQVNKSRPKLDPTKLDAIILSHCHLDHSGDVNVMIEAMTEGGFKKRGIVFCPQDAAEDGVMLKYVRKFVEEIKILKANTTYQVGDFSFETSMKHFHPVETYGIKFKLGQKNISFLIDTKYFTQLKDFYSTDILVISVVFAQVRPEIEHLSIEEVKRIIQETKPQKAILTHFGMSMIKAKPHLIAAQLSQELGREIVAAYDGMTLTE